MNVFGRGVCGARIEGKEGVYCFKTPGHKDAHGHEDRETVNHPLHYGGGDSQHEHVKCMLAIGGDRDALLYNSTKYIWRVLIGGKGTDPLRDLKAAAWYLNKRIERLEEERSK